MVAKKILRMRSSMALASGVLSSKMYWKSLRRVGKKVSVSA